MYDLTSPNKCQPLFLDHDDETDENEAAEVDEAVDEVGEDEAAEEVDEDEEAEAEAGEEVQQTIVVHEGTTISPWMLAFFLPLLLAVGAALFLVFQAAVTSATYSLASARHSRQSATTVANLPTTTAAALVGGVQLVVARLVARGSAGF